MDDSSTENGTDILLQNSSNMFFVKSGRTYYKLFYDEVLYFESEKEYVRIVTKCEMILVYQRLKMIDVKFGMPFIRIHNSFIINIDHLEKVHDNHAYINGFRIPITAKFKSRIMTVIYDNIL